MMNVPDPRDLAFQRWAAELALQDPLVSIPLPNGDWRSWAINVLAYSSLTALLNPPDPRYYSDWRVWGVRLKQVADAT